MLSQPRIGRWAEHWHLRVVVLFLLGPARFSFPDSVLGAAASNAEPAVLEIEGKVEVSRGASGLWDPAYTNQVLRPADWVRTGERSRAVVRVSDLSTLRLGEQTLIQVPPPATKRAGFNFLKGILYYFHRDKPGVFPVQTPTAYAVILGTEFTLSVADNGATRLDLIDGRVTITNALGALELASAQAAIVQAAQAPARTPAIAAINVLQWSLYYPGVLDLEELRLTAAEKQALGPSLASYQSGDLLDALARYPQGRQPASDAEKLYLAGLLLSVGQVDRAEIDVVSHIRAAESVAGSKLYLSPLAELFRHPEP